MAHGTWPESTLVFIACFNNTKNPFGLWPIPIYNFFTIAIVVCCYYIFSFHCVASVELLAVVVRPFGGNLRLICSFTKTITTISNVRRFGCWNSTQNIYNITISDNNLLVCVQNARYFSCLNHLFCSMAFTVKSSSCFLW